MLLCSLKLPHQLLQPPEQGQLLVCVSGVEAHRLCSEPCSRLQIWEHDTKLWCMSKLTQAQSRLRGLSVRCIGMAWYQVVRSTGRNDRRCKTCISDRLSSAIG